MHPIGNAKRREKSMQQVEMGVILHWLWRISPVLLGAAGGYLYYRFVGCKSGVCPITRNPWISTIYGAVIGALLMPK
jgi:hypothetical protein